jgi:hypothetical protein
MNARGQASGSGAPKGRIVRALVLVLAALVVGAGSAMLRLRFCSAINDVQNGPWRSSTLIGSSQAAPFLRAAVAMNGILALNRGETLYFSATTDEQGQPLSGACRYHVSGRDPDARWWSLTAYGTDMYLVRNPQHRYSATRDNVRRDADGRFAIELGGPPEPAPWIALPSGRFVLTLRAYNPGPALTADPAAAELPRILRGACP